VGDLNIVPIEEIIKKAISHIENPKDFSFSEYINQIEKKAHEIYLEEEKKAIKSKLLEKFNPNSVLKHILEELADLIQKLSVIIANTRGARAGVSSEYILREALLRYAGVLTTKRDEIIIDCNNRTSERGIYAAGDCTNIFAKQIITAAGEGAKALLSIYHDITYGASSWL